MKEDILEVELGKVFNITYGKGLPTKKLTKEGFPVFGANGVIGFYTEYKYEEKQVLISCRGAASGKINISPEKCFITNNSLVVESNSELILKKFLYFILSGANRSQIVTGSAQPQVTINNANTLLIKLAPLPIQRAIVSKIEALFSDLDNGIANFKKAQAQLKVYRQAVLKKAFEGELTSVLFNEWEYSTLKESVKFSQGIQVDVNLQSENRNKDSVRFLRIIDFTQGNEPARYIDNPGEKYIVYKNDVSLVRYGASTGFVCSNLEGAIANNLFRVIPIKPIEKKYLYYFLCSPLFQNIISQSVKGAAMPAISFGLINDVVLPFPKNISEQTQIVQEIESRLSVCDKMEQSLNESIEKAEALRQSILKKAFEGKLLSEVEIAQCKAAADYEPAGELLKKIKAEKLAKEQEKKKKPTVKKKSKK